MIDQTPYEDDPAPAVAVTVAEVVETQPPEDPGAAVVVEPANPIIAATRALLPFPRHWDSHLQLSTQAIFEQGRLDEAVRDATLRLEARIRALCAAPPDRIGVDLVGDAFKPNGGFLEPLALPAAERDGLHHLFRGAIQQIRNPVGHRNLGQHPGTAFDTIAFVNYLLGVADEAALTRYVYPFVGRWAGPRIIEGVHRSDLDGDGNLEIVVLTRWQDSLNRKLASPIVLKHDGLSPVAGRIQPVPAEVIGIPVFDDLDGDDRPELLFSGGSQINGRWEWRGAIVDMQADGRLRSFGSADPQFSSTFVPFEVLQLMEASGKVVSGWTDQGAYRHWSFDEHTLTTLDPEAENAS